VADGPQDGEEEEIEVTITQTFAIFKDLLFNKHLQLWYLTFSVILLAVPINDNVT
jgi:hypothetical protein